MKTRLNVGWIPRNDEARVASVRIRCLNPIKELRRRGFPIELFRERRAHQYTLIIFSKAYRKRDVELAMRLKSRGVKIVFDLCDNHFLKEEEKVQAIGNEI